MAIDTTNEKLALIEYGDIFQPGIPISADGIDQADKQHLIWEYPGILWGVVVTGKSWMKRNRALLIMDYEDL